MSKMNLKTKLITAFLLVGLVPVTIATGISWWNGTNLIMSELESKLTSTRDIQKVRLDDLLKKIFALTRSSAENLEVKAALMDFRAAFDKMPEQLYKKVDAQKASQQVTSFYQKDWANEYQKIHKTAPANLEMYLKYFDEKTTAAQYSYAANNPEAKKSAFEFFDDGTDYSAKHKIYHKPLNTLGEEFGMDDVVLVDARSGYIIWTGDKEIDFGLNIKRGPLAESLEGKAFAAAMNDPNKAHITDMERFFPSLDRPSIFVSSAIKIDEKVEGVIIFQVPFDIFDEITNLDKKWKERGLGDTGEMFIIGKDKVMRTSARGILENKEKYLSEARASGVDEETLKWMNNADTSATSFVVKSVLAERAVGGDKALALGRDYRGQDVIMAFEPLDGYQSWFLMTKIDQAEGLAGVNKLKYILMTLIAVSAGFVFLIAWMLGSGLSNSIAAIASRLGAGSEQVAQASQEIATGATELSESATEQAASLQETSAAVDEISAMVNRSAENAEQSRNRARASQERIQDGKRAISDMLQAMSSINESNELIVKQVTDNAREFESVVNIISEIGNRTKVINDIVFQTKLLSFNASVEAARAGEHGKGFAVVAEEVGNLAQMSGNAAKEISGMLENSIKKVTSISNDSKRSVEQLIETGKTALSNGNEKARSCDKVFDEIMQDSSAVTSIVEEIATSAREQATGIQEVTKAMGQLDQATQQNTAVSQQSSAAAEQLSGQSNDLHQMVVSLEAIVHGSGNASQNMMAVQHTKKKTTRTASTKVKDEASAENGKVVPLKPKTKPSTQTAKKVAGSDISVPSENDPRFEEV